MPPLAEVSASYEKQVFAIAYQQANRMSLQREEAEDCAMEFMRRVLSLPPTTRPTAPFTPETLLWLHRCARNHASNHVRRLARRRQTERTWTECFGAAAERFSQSCMARGAGPRTLTMRGELWRQVRAALKQLSPSQRELFVRYHLRNYSISDLANRFDRTPHAVEEALSHTRKRLALLLIGEGWTDADIHTLFRSNTATVTQRPRA
jgi:RNA polymerase sigma factor (sigma-70 family)